MRPHSHTAETSQSGQPLQHLADYLIRLRLLSPHQETIHDYYDHLRIILGIEGRFYLALLAADEEISSTLIHPVASRGRAESHILEERLRKWCNAGLDAIEGELADLKSAVAGGKKPLLRLAIYISITQGSTRSAGSLHPLCAIFRSRFDHNALQFVKEQLQHLRQRDAHLHPALHHALGLAVDSWTRQQQGGKAELTELDKAQVVLWAEKYRRWAIQWSTWANKRSHSAEHGHAGGEELPPILEAGPPFASMRYPEVVHQLHRDRHLRGRGLVSGSQEMDETGGIDPARLVNFNTLGKMSSRQLGRYPDLRQRWE